MVKIDKRNKREKEDKRAVAKLTGEKREREKCRNDGIYRYITKAGKG